MEDFCIDGEAGRSYQIRIREARREEPDLVRTLIDIDLQTFSEATFSAYTATALLDSGCVFLLQADDLTIGSCVTLRCWERPNEAMILSMGIRPGWRGRGLGQRFVAGVLERLRGRGLRSVVLLISADNRRALKVYHDVGFESFFESEPDRHTGEVMQSLRCRLATDDLTAVPFPPT